MPQAKLSAQPLADRSERTCGRRSPRPPPRTPRRRNPAYPGLMAKPLPGWDPAEPPNPWSAADVAALAGHRRWRRRRQRLAEPSPASSSAS